MIARPASLVLSSPENGHAVKYAMTSQLDDDNEEIICKFCQRSYQEVLESEKLTVCCPFCPWLTSSVDESFEGENEQERDAIVVPQKHSGMLVRDKSLENEWNGSQTNGTFYHTRPLTQGTALCTPAAAAARYDQEVTMPVIVMMSDFEQLKRNNERWYSPVFCTHKKGYHFRLRVDANGWCGTGDSVAVVVSIVKGDYDDQLQWPFEGVISVQILNHISNSAHSIVKEFIFSSGGYECQRVMDEAQPEYGCWCDQFTKHDSLYYNQMNKSQYLKDDCLLFLVTYTSLLLATC